MSDPAVTRLDPAPTRLDAPPTRLDRGEPVPPLRSIYNLPAALAAHWRIAAPLPAGGAEAELFIVASFEGEAQAVAKLYRPGVRPPAAALDRLASTAARHVVRILERGESDGVAYELMEYCQAGSLREHLAGHAGDLAFARRVLDQLAPALAELHAAGLIHRDLKPQNVLVRQVEPLDLVLTDFGIASIADTTVHFTSVARTVRYAPPEAMTGVLTTKADYWSLGMMLLEILAGRHPFDGLSEAVTNHQLLTRSVDVTPVRDLAWRALVRGLLLRDPTRRWGGDEIARWLNGDPILLTSVAPADDDHAPAGLRPYVIQGRQCTTARELALALIEQWPTGAKDVSRGLVGAWLRQDLRDQDLVRFVLDLAEAPLSPDQRLLRFALHVVPDLPAAWQGVSLADASLRDAVQRALAGDADAAAFLRSLFNSDALALYARQPGHADAARLAALDDRWHGRVGACRTAEQRLADAERAALRAPERQSGFANFDALVFAASTDLSGDGGARLPHALLLAPELAPDGIEPARQRLAAVMAQVSADAPWFAALGMPAELPIDQLAALSMAADQALRFAAAERARRQQDDARDAEAAAQLRKDVDRVLASARLYAGDSTSPPARAGLRELHDSMLALHARAFAADAHGDHEEVRRVLRRASAPLRRLRANVDRLDHLDRIRAVVLENGRAVWIALAFVPFLFRLWRVLVGVLGAAALAALWYVWMRLHARAEIRRCLALLPTRVSGE